MNLASKNGTKCLLYMCATPMFLLRQRYNIVNKHRVGGGGGGVCIPSTEAVGLDTYPPPPPNAAKA